MASPQNQSDPVVNDLLELAKLMGQGEEQPVLAGWPNKIGSYELIDDLGWGGQAVALLAYDRNLQRNVVLKVYKGSRQREYREMLLAEGRRLAKINNPYVVRCYAADDVNGCPYLVLEHLQGTPLDQLGRCEHKRARSLVSRLAEGLQAIHDSGLVHGDIRPSNIIVDAADVPRFIDFGISSHGGATHAPNPRSTFCAPEVQNGSEVGDIKRADIYSLGGVLYFLLTGSNPPADGWPCTGLQSYGETPVDLTKIASKALAPLPADRFGSASEFNRALSRSRRMKAASLALLSAGLVASLILVPSLLPTTVADENLQSNETGTLHTVASDVARNPRMPTPPLTIEEATTRLIASFVGDTVSERLSVGLQYEAPGESTIDVKDFSGDQGATLLPLKDDVVFSFVARSDAFVVLASVDYDEDGNLDGACLMDEPIRVGPNVKAATQKLTLTYSQEVENLVVLSGTHRRPLQLMIDAIKDKRFFRGIRLKNQEERWASSIKYRVVK